MENTEKSNNITEYMESLAVREWRDFELAYIKKTCWSN